MAASDNKLSTTALAKQLEIPTQQLFTTLKDYGWIARSGDQWVLTPKGEFEGGTYQKSQRYGTYIVWPERLDQHPLLSAIESNQRITAATMCRYYPRLHARQINRALAEMGLQEHSILGWELTDLGKSLGGQQEESKSSGAYYVTWPHEIIDNAVVHRELQRQSDQLPGPAEPEQAAQDLFDQDPAVSGGLHSIDGRMFESPLLLAVSNWLYLAQLAYAHPRALPVEESLEADFYVPAGRIFIDCWDDEAPVGEMTTRLRKREVYAELGLRSIEINPDDIDRLDEVLGRGLLAFGIRS